MFICATSRRLALATAMTTMVCSATTLNAQSTPAIGKEVNNRVIVKMAPGANLTLLEASVSSLNVSLDKLRDIATGGTVIEIHGLLDQTMRDDVITVLDASTLTEYAELDAILHPMAVPNDPSYGSQWHYFESTAGINGPAAWDVSTGAGATIAVIDTGSRNHVDLDSKIVGGYDFISDAAVGNDGNGRDSDYNDPGDWTSAGECYSGSPASNSSWHGTHVAGTIAAETNNGQGVAGVAWDADLVTVRVLGKCGGYTSDIADGIIWASGGSVGGVPTNSHPADVLNLSLGGSGSCPSTTQSAINTARANGATVVVAAGNSNANAGNYTPASCAGVITVAAVDRGGNRAYYSNYGSVVDVAAPGGETATPSNGVLSTLNTGTTSPGSDSYEYYQGTSMATPHIAGVAALLYANDPTITPDEVETAITSTARSFPGSCSQCGSGIVDAYAALTGSGGGGFACPAGFTTYTGSLSGTGDYEYQPGGTYYYEGTTGYHDGILEGDGPDFDLRLWKWNGGGWSTVASSLSANSSESISYYGSSGYYVWRIESYSGSGSYTFCLERP